MNDAAGQVVEQATFCKLNDDKRPQRVGLPDFTARDICPADLTKGVDELTNAYPDGWYIRIVFDELLDPNIEELTEIKNPDTGEGTDTYSGSIANTHPVKLECESIGGGYVEVEYDGYYSPAGNNVTWPLGPSLVVKPLEPRQIATGKACRVTLNDNIVDKTGIKVPDAQRGPYTYKIAPIQVVSISPSDDPMGASPVDGMAIWGDNFDVVFNTVVDATSVCNEGATMDQCEFKIAPEDTGLCTTDGAACVVSKNGADCATAGDTCDPGGYYGYAIADNEFGFGPNAPVQTDHAYTFDFLQGAKLKDRCGVETAFGAPSVADNTEVHFQVNKLGLNKITPGDGDLTSGMKKPDVPLNNVVDLASLVPAEYTISPVAANASLSTTTGGDILFAGDYKLNTDYTLTLKSGATIKDTLGETITLPADKVIHWKTQPAITMTSSPADLGSVTKATPTSSVGITLTFNQSMKAATLTAADYTLVDSTGAAVAGLSTSVGTLQSSSCTPTSTGCQLRVRGNLAPGDYTFTLKQGAAIDDVLTPTTTFTQAADKVIHFTVKNADPVTPIQCL